MKLGSCDGAFIKRMVWLGLTAGLLSTEAQALSVVRTEPVALSKMELGILEAVACKDNNPAQAAEIKAEVDLDYRKAKTAVVRCKTQQEFMGRPAFKIVYCGTAGERWECRPGPLLVEAPLQGRQVKLYLMGLGPQEAFEAVSKVIGLQFQGYFLDKIVGEFCDVSKNKFPAEIEFNCDGGKFVTSKYCLDSHCPRILSVN